MKDRILKIIQEKKYTAAQFADKIGIQRASVSHILTERNKPSLEIVLKILSVFNDINPKWLLFGEDSMYINSKTTNSGIPSKSQENTTLFQSELFSNTFSDTSLGIHDDDLIIEDKELFSFSKKDNDKDKVKDEIKNKMETAVNVPKPSIEKIVVFYTNKTFKEYTPSE